MKISVRFWWESCDNFLAASLLDIFLNNLFYKILRNRFFHVFPGKVLGFKRKARHFHPVALDDFFPHTQRAHPQPAFAVERSIDNHPFHRFRMAGDIDQFIAISLKMAIDSLGRHMHRACFQPFRFACKQYFPCKNIAQAAASVNSIQEFAGFFMIHIASEGDIL